MNLYQTTSIQQGCDNINAEDGIFGSQELTSNTGSWARPNNLQISYRKAHLACIHSLQAMTRLSQ